MPLMPAVNQMCAVTIADRQQVIAGARAGSGWIDVGIVPPATIMRLVKVTASDAVKSEMSDAKCGDVICIGQRN